MRPRGGIKTKKRNGIRSEAEGLELFGELVVVRGRLDLFDLPGLDVLGESAGLDRSFRADGLDLKHAGLGVELGVAAVIGVRRTLDIREVLDEYFGVER